MALVDSTTTIFDRDSLTIHHEDEPPKEMTKEDMDRMAREMGMSLLGLDHRRQPCNLTHPYPQDFYKESSQMNRWKMVKN